MNIDHLMWAAPDLERGRDQLEALFGVRPVPGGSHPGLGTRNALLGLGERCYLELIAPDPDQALAGTFGACLQALSGSALVTFAVADQDLAAVGARACARGLRARGPVRTARTTPAGDRLEWDLLFLGGHAFGALCPFFIDWRASAHPSTSLPQAGTLLGLDLGVRAAPVLSALYRSLGVPLAVQSDDHPWLRARIGAAAGEVVLASSAASVRLRFG
ncbi:MAG TPA: VOC family protein [Pseudomonadales bacterium]|nr:VOC family protein [Pseudomonadales bacterium]